MPQIHNAAEYRRTISLDKGQLIFPKAGPDSGPITGLVVAAPFAVAAWAAVLSVIYVFRPFFA
jgi:hypothetical protein